MSPAISVLITMAPGRENNLRNCLWALSQQDTPDFELIIADDGSESGQQIAAEFTQLKIHYLWRANDRCVSRSRNLASKHANAPLFLFLDCDVLLHSRAVQNYLNHFEKQTHQAIAGYMGTTLKHVAESVLRPGCEVNYGDRRIHKISRKGFELNPLVLKYPYRYCWSANFAVSRHIYEQVGGFDERYFGWGGEDEQFGLDLIRKGFELNFAIDTWGEHQVHSRNTVFHEQMRGGKVFNGAFWGPVKYSPQMYCESQSTEKLISAYFDHYLLNDPNLPEITFWQMKYPDAILTI